MPKENEENTKLELQTEAQIVPRSKENIQQVSNENAYLGLEQTEGRNLPHEKVDNVAAKFGLEQQTRQVGKLDTNLLMEYRAEKNKPNTKPMIYHYINLNENLQGV